MSIGVFFVPAVVCALVAIARGEGRAVRTFYDASWAAAAGEMGMPLISADRQLLAADLAESATEITSRRKSLN